MIATSMLRFAFSVAAAATLLALCLSPATTRTAQADSPDPTAPPSASPTGTAGGPVLDVAAPEVERVTQDRYHDGLGPTQVLYHFVGQQAVLHVTITGPQKRGTYSADQTVSEFRMAAEVLLFPADAQPEAIRNEITRITSNVFREPRADPAARIDVPPGSLSVVSAVLSGASEGYGSRPGTFDDYTVDFHLAGFAYEDLFSLRDISDQAVVHAQQAGPLTLDPSGKGSTMITVDEFLTDTGRGPTLVIYTMEAARAVVSLVFPGSGPEFGFTATVFLFGNDATPDSIAKFVNNLHSDGLYVDPARPTSTTAVGPEYLSIPSATRTGSSSGRQGEPFNDYTLTYRIASFTPDSGLFALLETTGQTVVHVPAANVPRPPDVGSGLAPLRTGTSISRIALGALALVLISAATLAMGHTRVSPLLRVRRRP